MGQKQPTDRPPKKSSHKALMQGIPTDYTQLFLRQHPLQAGALSVLCMNLLDGLGKDSSQETSMSGGVAGLSSGHP